MNQCKTHLWVPNAFYPQWEPRFLSPVSVILHPANYQGNIKDGSPPRMFILVGHDVELWKRCKVYNFDFYFWCTQSCIHYIKKEWGDLCLWAGIQNISIADLPVRTCVCHSTSRLSCWLWSRYKQTHLRNSRMRVLHFQVKTTQTSKLLSSQCSGINVWMKQLKFQWVETSLAQFWLLFLLVSA